MFSYLNYEIDKPSYWYFDNEEEEDYSGQPPEVLEELNRSLLSRTS